MIIYKVTNKKNQKVYIGQTIHDLEWRKSQHIRSCCIKNYYNNYFHNALLKYGFKSFTWEVLCECNTIEELNEKEIYYIQQYNSANKEFGYNLKLGGENGGKCCEETKIKIGLTTKEKWKDPQCAEKMRNGLKKGIETQKLKGSLNYEIRECPICHKKFKCKPYEKKRYCSLECANIDPNHYQKGIDNAAIINHNRYLESLKDKQTLVYQWIKENKSILENVKFNNLTFLKDLANYINVKDTRTVAKLFGLKYKKELVNKLLEISKNIC